ncbi:MAG: phosphoribosylanthranilate isomerase [Candidatus Methanomethylophilus sp.]|nr:phosphoribosylanthranilate isomerase [Methanomethylophilus sp.]
MTAVKFCGLRREEDIDICNRLRPEYAGFVFWKRSRRYLEFESAAELIRSLDGNIIPVGVFLDQPLSDIIEAEEAGIRMVQLHGSEDQEFIDQVRETAGLPVMKAFTVKDTNTVRESLSIDCDYRMYDSGAGSGIAFQHSLLRDAGDRYFLAGGLTPENVGEAIRELHPYAVDTSSGIETDGYKDPVKMERFINAVRGTDTTEDRQ